MGLGHHTARTGNPVRHPRAHPPGAGLVSIIWIIGIWAIVWGITLIVLGVQLRKAANTTEAST
jgi:hypothetical protein